MEFTKTEVIAVEQVTEQANDESLRELRDLQLALVGGGIGDVVFG